MTLDPLPLRATNDLTLIIAPFLLAWYRYSDDLSLEDAIHTALLTLKEGFEGQMTEKTIEIGIVGTTTVAPVGGVAANSIPQFRKLTETEVRD